MLIIVNLEWKPCLLSTFFPTFLHFNQFYICVCNFQKKRGAGSVSVRRPVPVPFPVYDYYILYYVYYLLEALTDY